MFLVSGFISPQRTLRSSQGTQGKKIIRMKVIINPPQKDWKKILQRPVLDNRSLEEKVCNYFKQYKI